MDSAAEADSGAGLGPHLAGSRALPRANWTREPRGRSRSPTLAQPAASPHRARPVAGRGGGDRAVLGLKDIVTAAPTTSPRASAISRRRTWPDRGLPGPLPARARGRAGLEESSELWPHAQERSPPPDLTAPSTTTWGSGSGLRPHRRPGPRPHHRRGHLPRDPQFGMKLIEANLGEEAATAARRTGMSDNDLLTLDAVTIGYTSSPVVRRLEPDRQERRGRHPAGTRRRWQDDDVTGRLPPPSAHGGAILFEGQDLALAVAVEVAARWPGRCPTSRSIFRRLYRRGALPVRHRGQAVNGTSPMSTSPLLKNLARRCAPVSLRRRTADARTGPRPGRLAETAHGR